MSDATELRKLVKSLQGAASEQETISVLNVLKKEAKITEALLRESKAGLAVGKLRSHARKEVADLAKEIVKKWKTEVEKEKQAAGVSSGGKTGAKSTGPSRKASTASATPSTPTTPLANNSNGSLNSTRTAKSDGVKLDATGDKTRDKCMELIYDALAFDSGAPSELIFSRAKAIESAVLTDQRGTNAAYKNKIRQLIVNLKDKNNPGLRESVTSGDIPASKFAKMTSHEMASEERKAADNKIKQDNLFQSLGAEEQQAETDAFQCGRCKQRKCRYRQAQTRSADEPMTTFVTCVNCNNRWKFS
ncbi:transcription elongation factor [Dentipellis sp. KUC8613]|nr:transcription elongation factor [Dentipellis sp. KUC8613]